MKDLIFNQKKYFTRIGGFLFLFFLLVAIFAPFIAPFQLTDRFDPFLPPGSKYLLGTNDIGNDLFTEFIYGLRITLLVGLLTGAFSISIGVFIGLLAGYHGGFMDEILMGMTDIVLMIPRIPLIIVLSAFLRPSVGLMILVMSILWWTSTARVIRSRTIQIRSMGFIESARCLGFSSWHILFYEILPNIVMIIIPEYLITVASAMISEASLSFLGLGDPSLKSWGMMIHHAFQRGGFLNGMWWWYIPPGLGIILFVLSMVFLSFAFEETETGMGEETTIVPFNH
ncbi:MAG: ABC transporter permease [Candidatus Atribacteria bacterium]|nr:ABC transporter permease [Candidatus Atribacteria bacterium]